ncbi:hypothetical protein T484DRAFT_1902818 [Baffinella frigidus]|nr:hypothetical protein T484DRAFT_1902818 [Cryptophyta sp. CCMP2293]
MANYTGMPLYPARFANVADNMYPSASDLNLGQSSVTIHQQPPSVHQLGDLSVLIPGIHEVETRYPGFVGSPACMGVGGDAIFGSAVAYPASSVPMPYAQVHVMPIAQLSPSGNFNNQRAMTVHVMPIAQLSPAGNFNNQRAMTVHVMPIAQLSPSGNFNNQRAMTVPVSQMPIQTLPCANPAYYASAISAGHKPSAFTIADYNEPYGVRPRDYENIKGHAMHPHLHLLNSVQQFQRLQ